MAHVTQSTVSFRLPHELRRKIEAAATAEGRTVGSLIRHKLAQSLLVPRPAADAAQKKRPQ